MFTHIFKALNYSIYKHFGLGLHGCIWADFGSLTFPGNGSSFSGLEGGTRALGKASLRCRHSSQGLPLRKTQNTSKETR